MLQIGLRAHDYGTNVSPEKLADILVPYEPASIQLALAKALSGSCSGDCSFHPDTEKPETLDLLCQSLERLINTAEKWLLHLLFKDLTQRRKDAEGEKMRKEK
jgi:hypothetical protein